jgi:hypothetical protein
MRRRSLVAAACAVTVMATGTGTALAGEVTGSGEPTGAPLHANSICVFSGLNDDPDAPRILDDPVLAPNGPGGVAQSFGQDVTLGRDPHLFNPGEACRGGSNEEPEG